MTSNSILLFKVQDTIFGIDTACVQEIIELPELKCMADMPSYMAGFLNLRGEITQVLELNTFLGYSHKPYSLSDIVLILKTPEFFFGIIVSEALNVVSLSETTSLNLSNFEEVKSSFNSLISTIAKIEEEIIFILNPHAIYQKSQFLLKDSQFLSQLTINHPVESNLDSEDKKMFSIRAQNLAKPLKLEKEVYSIIPLIIITLGQEYFGIEPNMIKEIFYLKEFTPVPNAPLYLLGVVNLRGIILTLIDIYPLIKAQKLNVSLNSKILILNNTHLKVGIVVDEILDLIFLRQEDFHPLPIEIEAKEGEVVKNTAFYGQEMLGILDINKILESI